MKPAAPGESWTESSPLASCSLLPDPASEHPPFSPPESLLLDALLSLACKPFSACPSRPLPPSCFLFLSWGSFLTLVLQCALCLGPLASRQACNHPSRPCPDAPALESFPEAPAEPIAPSTLSSASVSGASPWAGSSVLRVSPRRLCTPGHGHRVVYPLVSCPSPLPRSSARAGALAPAWRPPGESC